MNRILARGSIALLIIPYFIWIHLVLLAELTLFLNKKVTKYIDTLIGDAH